MGLEDEQGYPHQGYVDFANNEVNKSTGTLSVRGVFNNPPSPSGRRLLRPGMFVRIRLPLGEPRPALLVCDKALGIDQGQKYLLVVDEHNTVQYRRVEAGPLQDDGLRVIKKGLAARPVGHCQRPATGAAADESGEGSDSHARAPTAQVPGGATK